MARGLCVELELISLCLCWLGSEGMENVKAWEDTDQEGCAGGISPEPSWPGCVRVVQEVSQGRTGHGISPEHRWAERGLERSHLGAAAPSGEGLVTSLWSLWLFAGVCPLGGLCTSGVMSYSVPDTQALVHIWCPPHRRQNLCLGPHSLGYLPQDLNSSAA